jgi:hypothetical protein
MYNAQIQPPIPRIEIKIMSNEIRKSLKRIRRTMNTSKIAVSRINKSSLNDACCCS